MLLRQRIRTPIWPYVAVVACLFLLSILASRSWRGHSAYVERPPIAAIPDPPPIFVPQEIASDHHHVDAHVTDLAGGFSTGDSSTGDSSTGDSSTGDSSTGDSSIGDSSIGDSKEEPLPEPTFEGPALSKPSGSELAEVLTRETTPQVAATEPPVGQQVPGQQVPRDVSVTETPALPINEMPAEPVPTEQVSTDELPTMPVEAPAVLEKSEPPATFEVAHVLPYPKTLVESYESLRQEPHCQDWANEALDLFDRIHGVASWDAPELTELFNRLAAHVQRSSGLAEKADNLRLRAEILRAGYATQRRLETWTQVRKVVTRSQYLVSVVKSSEMLPHLTAVQERLMSESHIGQWREYLMLDELTQVAHANQAEGDSELAKQVLKRMDSAQLSDAQLEIFRNPPFDAFHQELCRWTNRPVDYLRMLEDLELYEHTGTLGDAVPISQYYEAMRWSTDPEVEKVAELLNMHYRNSNVRVAMTAEFLNRMLPGPQQIDENVADNISGAQVYGTSHTTNQLQVVLVPDANNLRIGLEAHGEVESDTAASKGPATFYNQGFARYHARKLLLIDRRGMRVWRAEAEANSETELTGFETEYDALPLIGWLARSMARQQHDERYYEAKAETEAKLERHATSRFDEQVHERLSKAEDQIHRKFVHPFTKINLKPTPVELHTTEQRVIARYRLASETQVGAHTPRPQAPGDSLLSVQVHESALNNTLANLQLEGKRTHLRTLYQEMATTFARPDLKAPDDIPEDVIVQFAERDAVRVRCDHGRVTVTLRIKELKSGRARWTDFAVRAYYVPDSKQLAANLVRDGGIELIGERLGERLPLRVIFNKVLSKDRPFNLINQKLSENTRLQDLHVNQFVINDGWIGVAIGPTRAGELDHFAREKDAAQSR